MIEKKRWILFITFSLLIAGGLGGLCYMQHQKIVKDRDRAANLQKEIEGQREVISKTPELVKEVIVQRETDEVIKELLSDQEDINNLVRTLHTFEEESEITITSLKKGRKPNHRRKGRQDFEQVGYTLSFEGDAFQLLAFLDKVESHARFMNVTAFKLQAANRSEYTKEGGPRHRITLDVETYVYMPTAVAKEVKIDHYDRKRDLLISEITKRGAELRIQGYSYHGPQGRRDPFIDPRVPATLTEDQLTIEQQIALVDDLIVMADELKELMAGLEQAENFIKEMKVRAEMEEKLVLLDEEIRRIDNMSLLSFVPAQRRFENNVLSVHEEVRLVLDARATGQGPSLAALRQTAESMERHIRSQEYELAIEAFDAIEPRLGLAEKEDLKRTLVQSLRELRVLAQTVIEFEEISLDIRGIALYEGERPVALINGSAVSEGEFIGDELVIRNIKEDQIEFAFRGLVLARVVETGPPNSPQ